MGIQSDWSAFITARQVRHLKTGEIWSVESTEVRWEDGTPSVSIVLVRTNYFQNDNLYPPGEHVSGHTTRMAMESIDDWEVVA